ncbi:hypothetical protein BAE44_0021340 [Dichanthelium oligosanthes]|uniref:Hydrophobic seed protein domain-containing protein n=1 Tax=Dichanthelium oligosanthes TaxID=888268 RepID=A0A1E5UXP0_9POAL|nr:hypothetical protein BAE44_0021340 [Dichanthelium oligosanthes]
MGSEAGSAPASAAPLLGRRRGTPSPVIRLDQTYGCYLSQLRLSLSLPHSLINVAGADSCRGKQQQAVVLTVLVVLLLLSLGVAPAAACGRHPCPNLAGKCPLNAVKLGVCADVLDGLIHAVVGALPKEPYCSLISSLADLEAAVCVCLAINANILGVNLDVAVDLTFLVNYCGHSMLAGFTCA